MLITPTSLASSYGLTQRPLTAIPVADPSSNVQSELADALDAPVNSYELIQIGKWTTDSHAVESLDLSDECERLEREQRKLSRKQHGSANYEKQRRRVAECHADLRRKRRDFLHKLSRYYAREYDLVAVEDLNVSWMMESPSNSRNTASAAWRTFLSMLEYKCEREGTYFEAVDPRGTTKECAACGFTADRDWNAAWNILSRGAKQVGEGRSESTSPEIFDFWCANESLSS